MSPRHHCTVMHRAVTVATDTSYAPTTQVALTGLISVVAPGSMLQISGESRIVRARYSCLSARTILAGIGSRSLPLSSRSPACARRCRAVASVVSLGFFTMHARCWPFATNDKNLLKLASETVLMLVFLTTAVLRSALA